MADICHCKAVFFYKIKRSGDVRNHSFPLCFFFFIPNFYSSRHFQQTYGPFITFRLEIAAVLSFSEIQGQTMFLEGNYVLFFPITIAEK